MEIQETDFRIIVFEHVNSLCFVSIQKVFCGRKKIFTGNRLLSTHTVCGKFQLDRLRNSGVIAVWAFRFWFTREFRFFSNYDFSIWKILNVFIKIS